VVLTPGTRRCFVALCAVVVVLSGPAYALAANEYRTVDVESLKITIDSQWGPRTAPGYLPVRFEITNLGDARVVEIVGHGSRFTSTAGSPRLGPVGYAVRQSVRLARGDRVRLTVPVPVYANSESVRFEIREGGRTLQSFNHVGFTSRSLPDDASALIVADSGSAFGAIAATWLRTGVAPGRRMALSGSTPGSRTVVVTGRGSTGPLDFVLEPSRLPDNWLGFTSLRAVFIGPTEWEQLEEPQKQALLTWTACGGDLFFVDGELDALLPSSHQPRVAAPENMARAYFFGRIHLPASSDIPAAGLADVLTKATALQDGNWALPANRASDWGRIAERGFRLPIPGVGGIPARSYFLILVVFSLLIGPVNYWLLRRLRQQVLLVITAPLISIVFILMLAGYVVAGEGFGVRGRAVSFTMLDQVRKQAATRASVSLYAAGMAPGGGLRFARDVAVFPIGTDGTGAREPQQLDLTEAQRFASGVIQARSPTNLETIGLAPARERLTIEREGDRLTAVNGLGVPIRTLLYRAAGQVHHLADPLPPGERALLTPGPRRSVDVVPPGLPQSSRFAHLVDNLPEGAYLAVLERSPFWSGGVATIDERDSFHVVIGWLEGQP
jgi:hypothetical protein